MSISLIQQYMASAASVSTLHVSVNPLTVGSITVIAIGAFASTPTHVASVSNLLDNYQKISSSVSGTDAYLITEIWYCTSPTLPSVNITLAAGSGDIYGTMIEVSGANGVYPVDTAAFGVSPSYSDPMVSPSVTTTYANEELIAVALGFGTFTPTVDSPWGNFLYENVGTSPCMVASYLAPSIGTYSPTFRGSSDMRGVGSLVALKSEGEPVGINLLHNYRSAYPSTTQTITASTVGSLIVITAIAGSISSITDNAPGGSNTYVFASGSASTGNSTWYCYNAKAGATVITVTSGSLYLFYTTEWAGVQTSSNPLDVVGESDTTSANPSIGPTLTTTKAGDLLIDMLNMGGSGYPTAVGSPWTFLDSETSGQSGLAYYVAPSAGPYAASFTISTTPSHGYHTATSYFAVPTGASAKKKASTNLIF